MGFIQREFSRDEYVPKQERTLIIEYYRSELLDARCIAVSEEAWTILRVMFEECGFKIQEKELDEPFGVIANYEETRRIIDAVFSVQNLTRKEGDSCLPAIEKLVAEYARIK